MTQTDVGTVQPAAQAASSTLAPLRGDLLTVTADQLPHHYAAPSEVGTGGPHTPATHRPAPQSGEDTPDLHGLPHLPDLPEVRVSLATSGGSDPRTVTRTSSDAKAKYPGEVSYYNCIFHIRTGSDRRVAHQINIRKLDKLDIASPVEEPCRAEPQHEFASPADTSPRRPSPADTSPLCPSPADTSALCPSPEVVLQAPALRHQQQPSPDLDLLLTPTSTRRQRRLSDRHPQQVVQHESCSREI